jgi:glutamate-1-semialdehyde 2,1-aminomutase
MRIFSETFFSFTFAGEVASMAAAMKVLDILESTDALASIEANGRTLQDAVNTMANEAGLAARIKAIGRSQWSLLKFTEENGTDSPLLRNLFQQEAVKRGVLLLATHNMTGAHDISAIQQTLEAYAEVFKTLADWTLDSDPTRFLEGPMSQPVFRVR